MYCCRERSRRAEAASGHDRSSHRHSGALEILKDVSQVQIPLTMARGTFPVGLTDPLGPGKDRPLGGLWNISCGTAPLQWSMEHLLWDCPPSLVYGTSPVGLPPLSGLWNISCGTAPLQWSMEHLLISCGTAPLQWSVEHLLWDCPPSVVCGTSPVGLPP